MSSQHKKPILAFLILAFAAATLVGNQIRASAEDSSRIAPCHTSMHASDGVTKPPDDLADRILIPAACTPRSGCPAAVPGAC